ncbi:MAG: SCO family protein [Gammaproteobacteria bacterium]|nr:SCO family protein [Gammaproteobacteria bacterium]
MNATNKAILIILAIAISIGLGIYASGKKFALGDINQQLKQATYLYDQQKAIADFSLIDHNNNSFTPDNINNLWTFWFFGFTHCPDICPITLGTLSATVDRLKSKHNIEDEIKIIFVSVDPERDEIAKLKSYTSAFSAHALGVTAAPEQLAPFLKNMGIVAVKQSPKQESSDYLVDHSSSIFLIAPDTGISAVFGAPHNAEEITQDFLTIRKFYR